MCTSSTSAQLQPSTSLSFMHAQPQSGPMSVPLVLSWDHLLTTNYCGLNFHQMPQFFFFIFYFFFNFYLILHFFKLLKCQFEMFLKGGPKKFFEIFFFFFFFWRKG